MDDIADFEPQKSKLLQKREPYAHYYKMSEHDIARRIAKKRLAPSLRDKLLETILKGKAAHKSREASETRKKYLWRQLLAPLKYEIKMTHAMLAKTQAQLACGYYANPDEGEARVLALQVYLECLNRWVMLPAQKCQALGKTPLNVAEEKTKRFPSGLPNRGIHWVDWVPSTVRDEVTAFFDAIPYRPRAKRKIPFERRMPALSRIDHGEVISVFEEQRILLRDRTQRALLKAQRLAQLLPDRYGPDVDDIKTALRYINEAKEGEMLPEKWQMFFPRRRGEV